VNAAWTAVTVGGVLGSGGVLSMVWHAAKLAAVLDELIKDRDDHEDRIRALEGRPPTSRAARAGAGNGYPAG